MEYIEIVLKDVQTEFLETIINRQFQFSISDIMTSHFFSPELKKTFGYSEIKNWSAFFCGNGTGDIFLSKANFGMELKNIVILVSYSSFYSDITVNFGEDQFNFSSAFEAQKNFKKLFHKLIEIGKACKVDNIVIGYEPAEDKDMKIIEIHHGQLRFFNENTFSSPQIHTLCQVGREVFQSTYL